MKIKITVDLDEVTIRAIGKHYGKNEPADRETCRRLIESLIEADIATIRQDHEHNNKSD